MLILVPLLKYCFIEKQDGKKYLIELISPGGFKIILTLLIKTIVIQGLIAIIQVGKLSFEGPLPGYGTYLELGKFLTLNKRF